LFDQFVEQLVDIGRGVLNLLKIHVFSACGQRRRQPDVGVVEEGDIIDIDIENNRLDLRVDEKEIERRLAAFRPLEKPVTGYLKRYRAQVSSASRGAVFKK